MKGAGSSQVSWVKDSFESSGILSARSRLFHYIKICTRKNPGNATFPGFLAEKPGFEPGLRLTHTTPLAGEPLRPLGYFSMSSSYAVKKTGGERGIRTPGTFRYHWFSRPAPSTARPSLHNGTSFISIPRFHRFVKRKFTFFRGKCAARGITAAVRRPGAPESRRERQRSWSEKRLRIHAPFPRSADSPSA